MRILNFGQLEIFFPIWLLFLERSWAETDFHPAGRPVIAKPGVVHVAQVLALCDGTFAQGALVN